MYKHSECLVLVKLSDSPYRLGSTGAMKGIFTESLSKKASPRTERTKQSFPKHAEPTLFPRLQIYFADFPSLFYSTNEWFWTIGTWCGYWYDLKDAKNTYAECNGLYTVSMIYFLLLYYPLKQISLIIRRELWSIDNATGQQTLDILAFNTSPLDSSSELRNIHLIPFPPAYWR